MKLAPPLLLISLLAAAPADASKTICWVSDQFVRTAGTDTSDNNGTPTGRFSAGAGPYADEAFVTLLLNSGYKVTRYNPPDNTVLPQAEVDQLNTFDLVVLGRGLGSGAFDSAAEAAQWNTGVTRPLLCTNTYLSRSNRLGWFSAPAAPVQPDQVLNPLTFTNIGDPVQTYLSVGMSLSGSTTVDSITENFSFPNDSVLDIRGISNLTGSTINPGGTIHATSVITAGASAGQLSPYIASLPAGTQLSTTGTGAVANGQLLGGYRLQFLAGIRESATAPNNGVRNAGYESLTPVGEQMLLRSVALAMNSGSVPADADFDGIIDSWENTHFGGTAAAAGLDDTDADGLNNLIEYAFNLNPRSGDRSAFSLGTVVSGLVEISITKQPYCCYVVEASPDMVTWTTASLTTLVDDATTLRVRETSTQNRSTFRVRVYPMPLP
jgi:hypothetical protein